MSLYRVNTVKVADTATKLRGRVISDRNGYQAIMTDSKEPGKEIIHCMGFTRIAGATVGDKVELTYVMTVSFNRKVGNKLRECANVRKRLVREFANGKRGMEFVKRMQGEGREPEYFGGWKGTRIE